MSVVFSSEVFCLSKDCILSSDWLMYNPSRVGVNIVAVLAILCMFGGVAVRKEYEKGNQAYHVFALLSLILSIYLRDRMTVDRHDSAEKYKASLFFNYLSAIWFSLANVVPYSSMEAVAYLFLRAFTKKYAANAILHVVHFMMIVLMIIATILMFNTLDSKGVDTSVYITQSVAFFILTLALTTLILTVVHLCKTKERKWVAIVGTLARCLLLMLWASFMASRMFISLDSPVRDSEAMFYFFNFIPLLFTGTLPNSLLLFHSFEPFTDYV
ncbi:hypothetical protein GGF38_002570 [Coemansia sp. RSA 25]|nr:hypothetical protein GGF38_002570 [Coemansia sp. RSA 25]